MRIRYWSLFILSLLTWQKTFALEKIFSINEVQAHNTTKECWIIVNNNIYDITKFIKTHDGKCEEIKLTDFCGKDASAKWIAKQRSEHVHKRKSVLEFERSRIGTLNQT